MPSKNNNPFKAGLFIVISFAVAIAIFFGITGSALLNGPTKTYRVAFDLTEDVGGLAVGSEVRIGGVTVGKVNAIDVVTVDPSGRNIVQASFSMPERFALKRDAGIAVQAPLTGVPNLNITSLGNGPVATETDELDGQTSGFAAAIDQVNAVGTEARAMLADLRPRLNHLVDVVEPRATAALDEIHETTANANGAITQIRTKIDPAYEKYVALADLARTALANASSALANVDELLGAGKGDLRQSIADLAATIASVREKIPGILDRASVVLDDVHGSLAKTAEILEDAKATVANTREFTGSARSILTSNRSRIDEIIKSVKLTADNLGAASGEIRRSPWRLLYQPKENEVANQNLFDATRQFADASRKLQDSATALRDLANDPNADQATAQTMLDALNQDFAEYQRVEAALWERVKQ